MSQSSTGKTSDSQHGKGMGWAFLGWLVCVPVLVYYANHLPPTWLEFATYISLLLVFGGVGVWGFGLSYKTDPALLDDKGEPPSKIKGSKRTWVGVTLILSLIVHWLLNFPPTGQQAISGILLFIVFGSVLTWGANLLPVSEEERQRLERAKEDADKKKQDKKKQDKKESKKQEERDLESLMAEFDESWLEEEDPDGMNELYLFHGRYHNFGYEIDYREGSGRTRVELYVMEKHQPTIKRLVKEITVPGEVAFAEIGELVPEPNNRYDPSAVQVCVFGKPVGYLSHGWQDRALEAIKENPDKIPAAATSIAYWPGGGFTKAWIYLDPNSAREHVETLNMRAERKRNRKRGKPRTKEE